jgi:hypothetical protein
MGNNWYQFFYKFLLKKNGRAKKTKGSPEKENMVPGTGFEPAHPFERCHLKTVRLPISPPGRRTLGLQMYTKTM